MHALFDPNSDYNKMRSEFDPRDKVYGYFLSLKFESERQDDLTKHDLQQNEDPSSDHS